MRTKILRFLEKAENAIWLIYYFTLYSFSHGKKLLKQNKPLNNLQAGTCFIVGTGPSLKMETRLDELSKYPVFSVNQLFRSSIFDVIRPDYHVMVDPLFFNLDPDKPEDYDTIKRIKNIVSEKKIQLIFPVDAYKKIKQMVGDGNYIYVKGRFVLHEGYSRKIRLDQFIPANRNVMQTAVEVAIAMGFNRIVLLGCDMTGLLDNYVKRSPTKDTEQFNHIYTYSSEEYERMKKVHATYSNEYMLRGFTQMFHDYRILFDYCKNRNITILNASQETALDELPFVLLNDILDDLKG